MRERDRWAAGSGEAGRLCGLDCNGELWTGPRFSACVGCPSPASLEATAVASAEARAAAEAVERAQARCAEMEAAVTQAQRAQHAAEERVAELECEVEGGGVEGARQRMVGAIEVGTLKEQLAAASARAMKAEALVAGARAEAAQQKSLASQLNRVLQTMQTRETNRAASETLDAKVQGVLGQSAH